MKLSKVKISSPISRACAYPGTAQIFWVPPIISGTGKATDFKFCRNIHRVDQNKSPWKMLGIVAVGVVRETKNFQGTMYRAHCAVIFAIAQLSFPLYHYIHFRIFQGSRLSVPCLCHRTTMIANLDYATDNHQ